MRDDSKDPGGDSQIPFVVRNDASHSDMLVATSDATWEAYNDYGGNSLYNCTVACPPGNPLAYKGADAVSYNRPFDGAFYDDGGASDLYYAEYQMINLLEQNGYDVSYTSDSDLDRNPSLLLNHKVFISSGHDEYWSAGERSASRTRSPTASTSPSSAATRCSGRRAGRTAPTAPTRRTGRSSPTRRRTTTRTRSTPWIRPIWTGTWGDSAVQPARRTAANPPTP